MRIEQLYQLAGREEIDYPFLMDALSQYARPREKISAWLKSQSLIRVKKGLYIFGPDVAQNPYALERLANLIYGPSALSLRYALAYHGLIPERVTVLTSITNKRNKSFRTPVGQFTYRYMNSTKYAIGIVLQEQIAGKAFLMASPEKALCDQVYLEDKTVAMETEADIKLYLFEDLRLDEVALLKLDPIQLQDIATKYQQDGLCRMVDFIVKRIKRV